eukprot:67326-Chlamydomonas_euryale.AAC.1
MIGRHAAATRTSGAPGLGRGVMVPSLKPGRRWVPFTVQSNPDENRLNDPDQTVCVMTFNAWVHKQQEPATTAMA